jgi:CRISPR-associated exonuclease Cas4
MTVSAAPDERDPEPIPISALQHAVYCMRQAALIHLERLWEENRFTAEGRVLHVVTHESGGRYARGVRRVTGLPIGSRRLGLAGVADLVEYRAGPTGELPYPVEFKRGKPKPHRADEVQLCAQALCLEEMTGLSVPEGALFYAEPKRRTAVRFDPDLRALTETLAAELRTMLESGQTPAAVYKAGKCRACSLLELCRPRAGARSARAWRQQRLTTLVAEDPGA